MHRSIRADLSASHFNFETCSRPSRLGSSRVIRLCIEMRDCRSDRLNFAFQYAATVMIVTAIANSCYYSRAPLARDFKMKLTTDETKERNSTKKSPFLFWFSGVCSISNIQRVDKCAKHVYLCHRSVKSRFYTLRLSRSPSPPFAAPSLPARIPLFSCPWWCVHATVLLIVRIRSQ